MAITLKGAASLNGTPEITCFVTLQNACKNPGYFSSSKPINKLSSWEGYSYTSEVSYSIYISLSNDNPDCFAGSVTATIKTYVNRKNSSGGWSGEVLYDGNLPSISESCGWLSVGAVSRSSTGTYTATVSYDCNCENENTRSCTLTATANGASNDVTLTQGADSITGYTGGITSTTYGNWTGGAITFSSTSDLSCGADSRTVYIQPWSRTKTVSTTAKYAVWKCAGSKLISNATSSDTTDYYVGTVTVSENGTYTSLNTGSYTASSSQATLTLSKSSCGTDSTSRTYITITATPSDPSGPSATSNGIYQAANGTTNSQTEYRFTSLSINPSSNDYQQGTFTVSYNLQYRTKYQYCSGSWGGWSPDWTNLNGAKPTITSNQSWCRIGSVGATNSSGNGSTSGSYDENTSGQRSATITASYGGASTSVTFTQNTGPNIIVKSSSGYKSWLGINLDISMITLAAGNYDNSREETPVGVFTRWNELPTNTNEWYANIYFDDTSTASGGHSNRFTAYFYLYDSSGNMIDSSTAVSGTCQNYNDTTIHWNVGRDTNSNIAKMVIEVSFS